MLRLKARRADAKTLPRYTGGASDMYHGSARFSAPNHHRYEVLKPPRVRWVFREPRPTSFESLRISSVLTKARGAPIANVAAVRLRA
jgi:hypothetical protein